MTRNNYFSQQRERRPSREDFYSQEVLIKNFLFYFSKSCRKKNEEIVSFNCCRSKKENKQNDVTVRKWLFIVQNLSGCHQNRKDVVIR